jgi:hypothetical protein
MDSAFEIRDILLCKLLPPHAYVPAGGDEEWYYNSRQRENRVKALHRGFVTLVAATFVAAGIGKDKLDEFAEEYEKQQKACYLEYTRLTEFRPQFFEAQDKNMLAEMDRNERAMGIALAKVIHKYGGDK